MDIIETWKNVFRPGLEGIPAPDCGKLAQLPGPVPCLAVRNYRQARRYRPFPAVSSVSSPSFTIHPHYGIVYGYFLDPERKRRVEREARQAGLRIAFYKSERCLGFYWTGLEELRKVKRFASKADAYAHTFTLFIVENIRVDLSKMVYNTRSYIARYGCTIAVYNMRSLILRNPGLLDEAVMVARYLER